MASQDIFDKYQDVLAVVRVEEGKVVVDTDNSRIDDTSLVIFLNEVITQYLQSNQVQE